MDRGRQQRDRWHGARNSWSGRGATLAETNGKRIHIDTGGWKSEGSDSSNTSIEGCKRHWRSCVRRPRVDEQIGEVAYYVQSTSYTDRNLVRTTKLIPWNEICRDDSDYAQRTAILLDLQ